MARVKTETGFTPEEDELQRVKGLEFRRIITEVTKDMVEATTDHAVFLSGGVDSSTTLIAMIEAGARPHCITFSVPGQERMSSDARKAKALADYYDLPFHIVTLPDDPDKVAKGIDKMIAKYEDMPTNRPSIEVLYIFLQMIKYAKKLGVKSVFSGLGDASIHLLGRSNEIRGRSGDFRSQEADAVRLWNMSDGQLVPVAQMCHDRDMVLCLPITVTTHMSPYQGVPWHVMNQPRKKSITIRAFQEEFDAVDVTIQAMPMQTGDSGTREYFDGMIASSRYAHKRAQREVDTAQKYYNSLSLIHRGERPGKADAKQDPWIMWRHNVLGQPLPAKYVHRWGITNNGQQVRAVPPVIEETVGEEDSLFDISVPTDEYKLDDEGNPDTRLDCWGIPFYEGDDRAMTGCSRAQRGMCGTYREDDPVVMEQCEHFIFWGHKAGEVIQDLGDVYQGSAFADVYTKWANKIIDHHEKMTAETSSKM